MITLNPNERIYSIKRRHWIVFFLELFPIGIIVLVLLGLILFFSFFQFPSWAEETFASISHFSELNTRILFLFFLSFFILICWHIAFIIAANYYLDCWIITSERTIHIELRNLFSRFYSSVSHRRIQDITVDIHGFLPTIFKYGDLKIQTAGAFKKFVFRQVPDPYKAKKELSDAQEEFIKRKQKNS